MRARVGPLRSLRFATGRPYGPRQRRAHSRTLPFAPRWDILPLLGDEGVGGEMPRWFPKVDNRPGVRIALVAGFLGALVFAGMEAYGILERVLRLQWYSAAGVPVEVETALLIAVIGRTLLALVAAWRFATGKGLVWGLVVLLLTLAPVGAYLFMGKRSADVGWVIARLPVAAALAAGIAGAWAARNIQPKPDYTEVFE